jgi:thioesterase domain-containing protein
VYGLQSPGLDFRVGVEPHSIEQMAARYVGLVRKVQPQGSYLLGGWCLGGLIAFEMARQLARSDGSGVRLFLWDTVAPLPAGVDATLDESTIAAWFLRDLFAISVKDVDATVAHLRTLDPEARLAHCRALAVKSRVLSESVADHHIRRWLDVYGTNLAAFVRYAPTGRYDADVTYFRARESSAREYVDSTPRWAQLIGQDLRVVDASGSHMSMMSKPYIEESARHVVQVINRQTPARDA